VTSAVTTPSVRALGLADDAAMLKAMGRGELEAPVGE